MQYFPPTALLFESVRNAEEDHNLKPLKTDILLDDAFDFEISIAISGEIVPGYFLVTLIRLAFLFTNSMAVFMLETLKSSETLKLS